MKKIIKAQFWVLLIGTIFAWANFVYELIGWIGKETNPALCDSFFAGPANPFLTPCFYGALLFLISFILSVIIKKNA